MNYEIAKQYCHIRSGLYRTGDPTKIYSEEDLTKVHPALRHLDEHKVGTTVPKVYWRNHTIPLDEQISDKDKDCNDWAEYDPRERPECSAFEEMPA